MSEQSPQYGSSKASIVSICPCTSSQISVVSSMWKEAERFCRHDLRKLLEHLLGSKLGPTSKQHGKQSDRPVLLLFMGIFAFCSGYHQASAQLPWPLHICCFQVPKHFKQLPCERVRHVSQITS